ncbi:MAG: TIGR04084 family radical SAM/SPASM domain-containing protein [Candidatus Bathyarchaeia archaeon]
MHYYLTLTSNCNMKCSYCYGKCLKDDGSLGNYSLDYEVPSSISYSVEDLNRFLTKDPAPTIVFYGGEPTLMPEKMGEIMDKVKAKKFILQTNGTLLDQLEPSYLKRLDTILVSLDGDESVTDYYRGAGTYRKVIRNLKHVLRMGFEGELIARMTVSFETNIYEQVKWLLFNDDFPFKSVHWQLDAQFGSNDFVEEKFTRWVNSYNLGVNRLVKEWVRWMKQRGVVYRIYPFVGLVNSMLTGEACKLRCGAGWIMFNVQQDGKITPCPVMSGIKNFYLGDIWTTDPLSLRDKVHVSDPCPQCEEYWLCGGRCLYANATKLWGLKGFEIVCETVKSLISSLETHLPTIRRLLSSGRISAKSLDYPRYNSCEIIP